MRTFAIGDIHGHPGQLDAILHQLRPAAQPGDTLVFLGDYIDRGPDSRGVIDRVLETIRTWDGPVVTLCGNHEDMLLDYVRVAGGGRRLYDIGLWEHNGGTECIESYALDLWSGLPPRAVRRSIAALEFLPAEHLEFFTRLQLDYEDEHAIYVHGGLCPGKPLAENSRYEKLWIRDGFIRSDYDWGKPVVYGHTPQQDETRERKRLWTPGMPRLFQPLNLPTQIGIDTGTCYGGYLTAVQLPERVFFSSEAGRGTQ